MTTGQQPGAPFFTHEISGGAAVVRIAPEAFDRDRFDGFREAVGPVLAQSAGRLAIDLSRVRWMSSHGFALLLFVRDECRNRGGGLAVFGLQPAVHSLFVSIRFNRPLPVAGSERDAVAMLVGSPDSGAATAARPARLAVMLSGGGRTLLNMMDWISRGDLSAQVALVIASRDCRGANLARERGLRTRVIGGVIPRSTLGDMLRDAAVDWVALAGYLNLVEIPDGFEGRVVNIHPALLPAFGGPGMYGEKVHRAVLEAGCKVTGCTVHLCDERYDTGPILAQRTCDVLDEDTVESLAARVFAAECELYPATLASLIAGRVVTEGRRARILST